MIKKNPQSAAIIRAISSGWPRSSMNIVAQGVERPITLDFLRAEACNEVQGFLGPAVPIDKYAEQVGGPPDRSTDLFAVRAGLGSVLRLCRRAGRQ